MDRKMKEIDFSTLATRWSIFADRRSWFLLCATHLYQSKAKHRSFNVSLLILMIRQTQLLLKSSVLKNKGFDCGMCKKGRDRRRKCKKRTEVISKHELRLSTNLQPKQERGSWMTMSHSPFIIRSSRAWWPVIRHYYHRWRRFWFDFKDVFKGILWGEGSGGGANERQGLEHTLH